MTHALNVAILVWDEVELMDFAGPAQVFAAAGQGDAFHLYTVAEYRWPLVSQDFLSINPEYILQEAPAPDVVVVPGGGLAFITRREPVLGWLQAAARQAQLVLSVRSGASVLAAAGLLRAPRAPAQHADPPHDRLYLHRGKIVTAASARGGIDAALYVVGHLCGERLQRSATQALSYEDGPEGTLL